MKKVILYTSTLFLLLNLFGCGISQDQYDALKSENETLKKQIDELKFGADRLLNQAQSNIDSRDYNSAKSVLEQLLSRHPGTSQAKEAEKIIVTVDKQIKEQNVAKEKETEKQKKLAKEKLSNATKKLRSSYDDIKGITWYRDKGTPEYANYTSFHLYMGKEKYGKPWLRFRIQYSADDWLFIESFVIKTAYGSYTIDTKYGEVERDNGSGGIWEWYDISLDNKTYQIVKSVIDSKDVKLRHVGKQYHKDRTISEKEKQGLQNILDAYFALGGTADF